MIALAYVLLSLSFYRVIHLTGLERKAGAAATPQPEIIGAPANRIWPQPARLVTATRLRVWLNPENLY